MGQSILQTIQGRSIVQSNYNLETYTGRVVNAYVDSSGNVTSADILIDGQNTTLANVVNQSAQRIAKGTSVTVNFTRGNKQAPQIIGGTGAAAASQFSQELAATAAAIESGNISNDQTAYILAYEDSSIANSYLLTPGANVSIITIVDPTDTSGGYSPGLIQITAYVFVAVGTLPNPEYSLLPPGTICELVSGSGVSEGMYRLVGSSPGASGNYWHLISDSFAPLPLNPSGSFTNSNITVDQFGRVTSATNGSGGGGAGFVPYVMGAGGVIPAGYPYIASTALPGGGTQTFTLPQITTSTVSITIKGFNTDTTVVAYSGDYVDGGSSASFGHDCILVPVYKSGGPNYWGSVHVP